MITKLIIPDNWNQVTVDQFKKLEGLSVNEHLIEITSILSGQPIEEVENLPVSTFTEVVNQIGWLVKLPDETTYNRSIEVDGKEYFLMKPSEFTVKEWIEYVALAKAMDYHKILALIYRAKGVDFSNAMIGDLYGALVFFCNTEKEYLQIIMNYSLSQITTTKTSRLTRMRQFFLGTNSPTHWRKAAT